MRQLLIVDDEPDICDCLESFFLAKGFGVRSVYSGEEALEQLAQHPADVVLLDILLPGLSGLEVLRRVRREFPRSRVVMVTALDGQDLRTSAWQSGAVAYITKPFELTETAWSAVLRTV